LAQTGRTLRIGLPKGSLQQQTFELMQRAGFPVELDSRSYFPATGDPELQAILLRPQEMSRYVEDGVLDAGLTGLDWIRENESDVEEVCELSYSKQTSHPCRWVLAVPEASTVKSVKDLQGRLVATELVNVTRKFMAERGVNAKVEYSFGATEAKCAFVDAIVELTETGSSLRSNRLRIVDTILVTSTRMIANKAAWGDNWKRTKIENLAMLLRGALMARDKVGLKMNVPLSAREAVLKVLPALKRPTISPLADVEWCAIETILDGSTARELIPELKRAGAQGIIEYPLNKVIP
jgi:ATP phosphoribosyltransferase